MDSLTSTHSLGSVECDKLISLLVVVSAMIARGHPCMDGYVRATAAWRGRVVVADCAGRYLCIALLCFLQKRIKIPSLAFILLPTRSRS